VGRGSTRVGGEGGKGYLINGELVQCYPRVGGKKGLKLKCGIFQPRKERKMDNFRRPREKSAAACLSDKKKRELSTVVNTECLLMDENKRAGRPQEDIERGRWKKNNSCFFLEGGRYHGKNL